VEVAVPHRTKRSVLLVAIVLGLLTAAVRFLALNGFSNDHYQHLAGAQQILLGEWPTRDFTDPGEPLMYVTSAVAQRVLGRTLLAEAVLVSIAIGIAAAAVVVAASQVSGSLVVGLVAGLLSVIAFPRPYGYPKLLLYSLMPLCIWAWVRRPGVSRLAVVAALVAISFLFRHDHGVYLGLAALATIALTPVNGGLGDRRTMVIFGGLVVLVLLPYLVYVQLHGGLLTYLQEGIAFSQREADRTRLYTSAIAPGDETRLYYLVRALPLVALAWLIVDWRRGWSIDAVIGVPVVLTALFVNTAFLRDPLAARLPDVVVPVVLVGAWLAGRVQGLSNRPVRLASMTALCVVGAIAAASYAVLGRAGEQLHRTNVWLGIGEIPRLFRLKTDDLTSRFARTQLPDGRMLPLVPFFEYVDRCSLPRHHMLVAGNAPELYVYAQRPFAAGQASFLEGYYSTARDHERQLRRVQAQVVAFVVEPSDQYDDWRRSFPELNAYVESRFQPIADIHVDSGRRVRVLVPAGLPPSGVDASTGWPCYR